MANNIDLALLRILRVLISERSVSRAADRVGLSQPATSHALTRLRRLFDDELLVPSRRQMVPTPRAIQIDRELLGLLNGFDRLVAPAEPFCPQRSKRRFVITATEYAEFLLLPNLVNDVLRAAPDVEIEVRAPNQGLLPMWLESGEVDLRIAWLLQPPPALKFKALFQDYLVCIIRRDHPAAQSTLTLDRYVSLPHARSSLIGKTTTGQVIDSAVGAMGFEVKVTVEAPNFLTIPQLVAKSDVIATVPARMAHDFARYLPLKVMPLPLRVPGVRYSAYWHDRNQSDAGHRWFREMITRTAKSLPPA